MDKFEKYIGLTYKPSARSDDTMDCWGMVVYIYKDLYGIELPRYDECSVAKDGYDNTGEFILSTTLYKKCQKLDIQSHIQEGDLILLTNRGEPTHIGIAINNEDMIHCFDKAGSVIESFRGNKWKKRVLEIRRHPHFL